MDEERGKKGLMDGGMEGWRDGVRRGRWGSWRSWRLESKKKKIKRDVVIVQSTCEHKLGWRSYTCPLQQHHRVPTPSSTYIEGR